MDQPGPSSAPTPQRLLSLDALRGFDMMWIAGSTNFENAFAHFRGGAAAVFLGYELDHAEWAGFHFYDLIFPMFVFMVGVSITFSVPKMIATQGREAALRRIFTRFVLLFLLGIFYSGGVAAGIDHIRIMGVLQRIAFAYLGGSLLFIYLKPRGLLVVLISILIGYWALLTFVPVPGIGAGHFAEGQNLPNWFDRMYLPWRKYDGDHDPEGIISTLSAIATPLLGIFAGLLLRDPKRTERQKAALLIGGGALLIGLGFLWGVEFPVVKKLWTSSFVLVAGGYSSLLLGLFYLVIDVWKVWRWAMPFVWIGCNALTIYLLSNVVNFKLLSARFVGGNVAGGLNHAWPGLGDLMPLIVSILICFGVARFLYNRKIFLRL